MCLLGFRATSGNVRIGMASHVRCSSTKSQNSGRLFRTASGSPEPDAHNLTASARDELRIPAPSSSQASSRKNELGGGKSVFRVRTSEEARSKNRFLVLRAPIFNQPHSCTPPLSPLSLAFTSGLCLSQASRVSSPARNAMTSNSSHGPCALERDT